MAGFGGSVKLTGETEYKKALKNIQQGLREVGSELKLVSAQYNSNDKSTADLSARSADLAKKIEQQRKALTDLKATYASMAAQYDANAKKNAELSQRLESEKAKLETIKNTLGTTSKEYQAQAKVVESLEQELKANTKAQDAAATSLSTMRTQINNAETSVVKAQNSLDGLNEELESTQTDANTASKGIDGVGNSAKGAKGGMDDLGEGAERADGDLKKVGEQADATGKKLEGLKNVATAALKALGIALAAAGAGAIALGKAAIDSYADYEQLVGGVDTLFKEGSKQVQDYAANAFKTAGLSANDYMETVTGFSASLIQSLDGDTVKAAEVANMAITDMSDNANKMGTDIASLQNAYQGFAKQNYTMLDNLKIGYGGTKEEMERLLADAEELSGVHYDISNLNDVYEAIHVIQTEMDITGTTALEAATTISGSTASMKAAWSNLMTGLADDNADFEGLVTNFVDSLVTVANNIIPRIKNVVSGISDLVNGLIKETLPIILEQVPPLISDLLPELIESVGSIMSGLSSILPDAAKILADIIPQAVSMISTLAPQLITTGVSIISNLATGLSDALPEAINIITADLIPNLISSITAGAPQIVKAATVLLMGVVKSIPIITKNLLPELGNLISSVVNALIESADILADAGLELFSVLSEEVLPTVIDSLISELPTLIIKITNLLLKSVGKLQTAGTKFFGGIITAITKVSPYIIEAIPTIVTAIGDTLTQPDVMDGLIKAALEMFMAIGKANTLFLKAFLPEVPKTVIAIGEGLLSMSNYLAKMSLKLFMYILSSLKNVGNQLVTEAGRIVTNMTSSLVNPLINKFSAMKTSLTNTFSGFGDWFRGVFSDAWSKVRGVFDNWGSFFSGLWNKIRSTFSSLGTNIASAISGAVKSGINGVISMIQSTINKAIGIINGAITLMNKLPNVNAGKISPISLPRLAKGGIVDRPTLAEVGEHGQEAIIPLENNKGWIKQVAAEISNAMIMPMQEMANNVVNNPNKVYTYDNLVNSFKDALADMKVILDDEQVGKFVEKTVADAIYT